MLEKGKELANMTARRKVDVQQAKWKRKTGTQEVTS